MLAAERAVAADYTIVADGNSEHLTAWPRVPRSIAVDCGAARTIAVAAVRDIDRLTTGTAATTCEAGDAGTATVAARESGSRDAAQTLIRNCRLRECD